mmetsp:Transcript_10914/g.19581  ORF Transcript_10914/g.19581 Transcript_10914/m.19581 type:complete len:81 (-) Transcript_10914:672-914(-)
MMKKMNDWGVLVYCALYAIYGCAGVPGPPAVEGFSVSSSPPAVDVAPSKGDTTTSCLKCTNKRLIKVSTTNRTNPKEAKT